MQRRPEFSFPGSPARGTERAPALPPRQRANPMAPRAGEEEIRWLQASRQGSPDYGSGGSGTPSPQLWAHHHRLYPASSGSSPSRAQAIAGYRREMLDLVRGLPESAYELSLRDIVEHPSSSPSSPLPPPPPSSTDAAARDHEPADAKKDAAAAAAGTAGEQAAAAKQSGAKGKKQGRKQRTMRKQRSRSLERSVSLDTGLLIKLFMPLSVGGGKKKVSPKPDAGKDGKKKKEKKQGKKKEEAGQEEEWWTKNEFSEAASSSRTSSTGSSNSSSSIRNGSGNNGHGSSNPRAPIRSRSRKRTGCYAFFRGNKSKSGVSQD